MAFDMFADLVPTYNANTRGEGSGMLQYNPATGFTGIAPQALQQPTAAAAAGSGAGTTVIPVANRTGPQPTLALYGTNFSQALYDWMRGGNPASLAHPSTQTSTPGTPGNPTVPSPGTSGGTGAGGAPTPTPTPTTPPPPPTPGTTPSTPPATNALSPATALNNFANSAGMQFQLQQGANTIQQNYAARGALQSGSAMKALQDYGQQTALNNYFMPYMGLLGGQQAVGAGAASSVAGVGSSFGNTAAGINANLGNAATGINAGMGSAIGGLGDANANAALLRGQANSQMWNGIGSGLGGLASSFFPH